MKSSLLLKLGLLAATVLAATPEAISYQRETLTKTNRDCSGSVIPPELTEPHGFVAFNRIQQNQLFAVAVLTGAAPNASYNFRLIQIQDGAAVNCGSCANVEATLATNRLGIGSTSVQQAVSPGATAAWVALNRVDNCSDFYTVPPLSIA